MNGWLPFQEQQKQTTETNNRKNAPSPKTITAANNEENYKLTRAATVLVL